MSDGKIISVTAYEVRMIGIGVKGRLTIAPAAAFKWGRLALRGAFLAMRSPYG